MTVPPEFLAVALQLAPEQRAALAASLLESLDGPADDGVEAAWALEIDRRVAELNAGTVQTVAWSDVRARALRHLSR